MCVCGGGVSGYVFSSHHSCSPIKHLPDFGCTIANDKDIRKFCGQDDIVWLDVRTMTEIDEGPRLPGSLNVHCSCQPGVFSGEKRP